MDDGRREVREVKAGMPRGRKKAVPEKKEVPVSPKVAGIEKAEVKTKGGVENDLKAQFLADMAGKENIRRAGRKEEAQECACCGKPITEANGVFADRKTFRSGYHPMCITCQQAYFAEISAETSRTYALFYACIAFDLPYKPSVIEGMSANQNGVWYEYVKRLQRDYNTENSNYVKAENWLDGITDIKQAFGGEFPVLPITGDVLVANMHEMSDRQRWDIEWGEEWSDADCRSMDDRFMMLTANRSGGVVPASVSMYLHDAIKYMVLRDHSNDSMEAKRYQDMAEKLMNSEYMKAWQSNKGESIQVDRVVKYLESMGAMHNGYLIGYDELVKVLGGAHGSYSTSLDVVDEVIMCILNTMRKNMGEAELSRLPLTAQVKDAKGELLHEISAEERKILEGLGVKPPERERGS